MPCPKPAAVRLCSLFSATRIVGAGLSVSVVPSPLETRRRPCPKPVSRRFCQRIPGALPFFRYCGRKMKFMKPMKMYQELLKSNELKGGRLLGLDVGDKYVGLAISDANNKIASPLSVLVRNKSKVNLMAADFQSLISEHFLVGFVFGYPFIRWNNNPTAVQVKLFANDLIRTGKLEGLKYTYWDECFTSKNVEFLLKPLKFHPLKYKTIMDKFAAVGILQGYLDFASRSEGQNQKNWFSKNESDSTSV